MIDSMLKFEFSKYASRGLASQTQWILSAGRDSKIILWKLVDGIQVSSSSNPEVRTFERFMEKSRIKEEKELKKQAKINRFNN